jgi:hypothetical protein
MQNVTLDYFKGTETLNNFFLQLFLPFLETTERAHKRKPYGIKICIFANISHWKPAIYVVRYNLVSCVGLRYLAGIVNSVRD